MGTKQEDLLKQMEYDCVKRWHEAGITGKDVVIWDMENDEVEHGQMTKERCLDSAPDAIVLNVTYNAISSANKFEPRIKYNDKEFIGEKGLEEFIKNYNVKICTRSIGGGIVRDYGQPEAEFWKRMMKDYGIIMFTSGGNDGENVDYEKEIPIVVGACNFVRNKVVRRYYSNHGKGLDFIDFTGWSGVYEGTSFSAPYLAGKCALLVQKYGNLVNQDFAYKYFKEHCEDLETEGEDNYTGWGLVKMGSTETEIKLQLNNDIMLVDGNKVKLDQPPIQDTKTWRTLVPLRAIAEAFGAEVLWDEKTKTITIVK